MKNSKFFAPAIGIFLVICFISKTAAYNDDRGIVKWNPYWLSNHRSYNPPVSYYGGNSRGGFPKRLGDRSPLSFGTNQIYKWSPVYFSADTGLFGRSMGVPRFTNRVSDGINGLDMGAER